MVKTSKITLHLLQSDVRLDLKIGRETERENYSYFNSDSVLE